MKKLFISLIIIFSIVVFQGNIFCADYNSDAYYRISDYEFDSDKKNDAALGVVFSMLLPDYAALGVRFKFDDVPMIFNVDFGTELTFEAWHINITGDWYALEPFLGRAMTANVYFYFGVGFALHNIVVVNTISTAYDYDYSLDLAINIPVGFSFVVQKHWDIFIETGLQVNLVGIEAGNYFTVRAFGVDYTRFKSYDFLENALSSWLRINAKFGFMYWF